MDDNNLKKQITDLETIIFHRNFINRILKEKITDQQKLNAKTKENNNFTEYKNEDNSINQNVNPPIQTQPTRKESPASASSKIPFSSSFKTLG